MEWNVADNPGEYSARTFTSGMHTQTQTEIQSQSPICRNACTSTGTVNSPGSSACAAKCPAAECSSSRYKCSSNSTSASCATSCADGCNLKSEAKTASSKAPCSDREPADRIPMQSDGTLCDGKQACCSSFEIEETVYSENLALQNERAAGTDIDGQLISPSCMFIYVLQWLTSLML